ncbi:hypothetical protein H9624_14355 [Actinomycetaceae bacterium Sa1BUA1]|uniref:DUF6318 domain-containing protein n=2 Tax=Oceanitalea stevensii TaxID=2763072 RepID=A0ABR8Z597_9MICO|nr:hypothetical protein [Oceanitalea stevensii]
MEKMDIDGAKAASRYFVALYPYVYVTGDLDAWRNVTHPECQFCASVIENVETLHGSGGYADGPALEILELEAAPPDDEYEHFSVWIDAEESDAAWYDADGVVTERIEGALVELDLALAWVDGKWVVRGAVGRDVAEGR